MSLLKASVEISRVISGGLRHRFGSLPPGSSYSFVQRRTYKNWFSKYRKHLFEACKERGELPETPRSSWLEWSYDAELFAFGKRLGENFDRKLLARAFTNKSYLEAESVRRRELGVDTADETPQTDNRELIRIGRNSASKSILSILKSELPLMPEEGIKALNAFLMSDDTLAHVSSHLGIKDLVLSAEFPPEKTTMADSLMAVIGALEGEEVRQKFVKDFIVAQLCGKNIYEIWNPANPKKLVAEILKIQGKAPPEPRLMRQSGIGTLEANYVVGVYCDKVLLGYGSGETVSIAEESASANVLRRMFGLLDSRPTMKFSQDKTWKSTEAKEKLTLQN